MFAIVLARTRDNRALTYFAAVRESEDGTWGTVPAEKVPEHDKLLIRVIDHDKVVDYEFE